MKTSSVISAGLHREKLIYFQNYWSKWKLHLKVVLMIKFSDFSKESSKTTEGKVTIMN